MIDDKNAFDMDFAVLEDRANQVRENTDFQTLVSQAMADKINNWKVNPIPDNILGKLSTIREISKLILPLSNDFFHMPLVP